MGFLRDIFAAVADVSGHMGKEQMREALKRAGLAPTEAQLERAWGVVDADRCGRVTLRDFVRGCGHVLVAHAFSPEACAQPSRADVELADLKEVYGGEIPTWWARAHACLEEGQGAAPEPGARLASLDALQRRFCFVQTRLADAGFTVRLWADRYAALQVAHHALEQEAAALRPIPEKLREVQAELAQAQARAEESEAALQEARAENVVARRLMEKHLGGELVKELGPLKSEFSQKQEALIHELQQQARHTHTRTYTHQFIMLALCVHMDVNRFHPLYRCGSCR